MRHFIIAIVGAGGVRRGGERVQRDLLLRDGQDLADREARPDSTGRSRGNLGGKQRIVAFVPKRNGTAAATPASDKTTAAVDAAVRATLAKSPPGRRGRGGPGGAQRASSPRWRRSATATR